MAKLNSENYFTWKFKVEMLLIKKGALDVLTKDKPATNQDDWIKRYNIALATVSLSL